MLGLWEYGDKDWIMVTETKWLGSWRVNPGTSGIAVPLAARSAGVAECIPRWRIPRTASLSFANAYWCYKGEGIIIRNGVAFRVGEGDFALLLPGESVDGYSLDESWHYRWLTFDGNQVIAVPNDLKLTGKMPIHVGACPHQTFVQLERELAAATIDGEYAAALTLYSLLLKISRHRTTANYKDNLATLAARCLQDHYPEPNYDINALSSDLKVHRSVLSRTFRAHYGLAPSVFLQSLRLERAMVLLSDSNLPMKDIARRCGFRDAAYFSRVVQKKTGFSPLALRLNKP